VLNSCAAADWGDMLELVFFSWHSRSNTTAATLNRDLSSFTIHVCKEIGDDGMLPACDGLAKAEA
jgi:hypothetical protein